MANYPITKPSKEGNPLHPHASYYSDEYAKAMCTLYLSDSIVRDERGALHKYYRLHAEQSHSLEDFLAYDILCPRCSKRLKLVGGPIDRHELGLYICKSCDKH